MARAPAAVLRSSGCVSGCAHPARQSSANVHGGRQALDGYGNLPRGVALHARRGLFADLEETSRHPGAERVADSFADFRLNVAQLGTDKRIPGNVARPVFQETPNNTPCRERTATRRCLCRASRMLYRKDDRRRPVSMGATRLTCSIVRRDNRSRTRLTTCS